MNNSVMILFGVVLVIGLAGGFLLGYTAKIEEKTRDRIVTITQRELYFLGEAKCEDGFYTVELPQAGIKIMEGDKIHVFIKPLKSGDNP